MYFIFCHLCEPCYLKSEEIDIKLIFLIFIYTILNL